MHQPINQYGEGAGPYLQRNIAVGVSLKDPRILVKGKLPAPNSALYRSRITPFQTEDPTKGGYHIELNMTLDELARLAAPPEIALEQLSLRSLGRFLSEMLATPTPESPTPDSPTPESQYAKHLSFLLRNGGITTFNFEGAKPRGAADKDSVPYMCFQFAVGNLEPDPQNRVSQMAHAIRRLNAVFDLLSKKGLSEFSKQSELEQHIRMEPKDRWTHVSVPSVDDFETLATKLKNAFGAKFGGESLTADGKPRLTEGAGETHLRLSFQPSTSTKKADDIFRNLRDEVARLNSDIEQQLSAGTPLAGGKIQVELVSVDKQSPYLHCSFQFPEASQAGLDADQSLYLGECLLIDFIDALKPFERHFVMQYSS